MSKRKKSGGGGSKQRKNQSQPKPMLKQPELKPELIAIPAPLSEPVLTSVPDEPISAPAESANQDATSEKCEVMGDQTEEATDKQNDKQARTNDVSALWRIGGTFTLNTPLHLGTGHDEPVYDNQGYPLKATTQEDDAAAAGNPKNEKTPLFHVASVARDFEGKPYIPASSLKGALRALAECCFESGQIPVNTFFGKRLSEDDLTKGDNSPGKIEFCNAYLASMPEDSHLPDYNYYYGKEEKLKAHALLPHTVRNRDYGTAEEGLLFYEQVIPPDTKFRFECTAKLTKQHVEILLGLLQAVGVADNLFRLGGGKSADNGQVRWEVDEQSVVQFSVGGGEECVRDKEKSIWSRRKSVRGEPVEPHQSALNKFWEAVKASNGGHVDMWKCVEQEQETLTSASLQHKPAQQLVLNDLELKFHTPFLVYQRNPEKEKDDEKPNGIPRKNYKGEGVLPSSSLHGALRSQAERILRTVGVPCKPAYEIKAVHTMKTTKDAPGVEELDLAALLFGAPGWRSLLSCTDFTLSEGELMSQPMIAIDRLTGGVKKQALFNIQSYDCPTLTGELRLDLQRLNRLEVIKQNQLLGLLAHVLRDLDQGDIPLAYGAAKGYGACTSKAADKLKTSLLADGFTLRFGQAIEAFGNSARAYMFPGGTILQEVDDKPSEFTCADDGNDENQFHNPYAFLPFGTSDKNDPRLPWAEHDSVPSEYHSHRRYVPNAFHGRLVCRLKTLTPIFIGAGDASEDEQENGKARLKANFTLEGKIALPATSLRGMLSSLHESITRSALRVMEERAYSVRKDINAQPRINEFKALSAIGRVHIENGVVKIEPLTLPTLRINGGQYKLKEGFEHCFPPGSKAWHKVLLEESWLTPIVKAGTNYKASEALGAVEPNFSFGDANSSGFWYLPLNAIHLNTHPRFTPRDDFRTTHEYYLIGQKPTPLTCCPVSQNEFDADFKLPTAQQKYSQYTRGLLRIMGVSSHQYGTELNGQPKNRLPDTCKYGLFIPYPVKPSGTQPKLLKCSPASIERFEQLANERFESKKLNPTDDLLMKLQRLPFSPINQARNNDNNFDEVLTPTEGDLVYFKPNKAGTEIEEISYSSIWRARVEHAVNGEIKNYDARQALPDKQLIAPMRGDTPPDDIRTLVSPSELLFGFVQDMGKNYEKLTTSEKAANPAKAFASKLRFGFGRFIGTDNPLLQEKGHPVIVPLKILASPKPPSPPFYFLKKNIVAGEERVHISKAKLVSTPTEYVHKGRKTYLHAKGVNPEGGTPALLNERGIESNGVNAKPPWRTFQETENVEQKARITPIADQKSFCFEIDFHNLSQAELESLCATLLPHETYRHKIGMGKPIGLGSVKIEVLGMFIVNRQARYRQTGADFSDAKKRYSFVWKDETQFPLNLPTHLGCEKEAIPDSTSRTNSPRSLAEAQMKKLDDDDKALYKAIVLTGDPKAIIHPVHYPQVKNESIETENYNWFMDNDKRWKNFLADFTNNSNSLPVLTRRTKIPNH